MDIYDELGVRKVINGLATVTVLGGSLMPPEVLAAMAEAAQHFVDIDELQDKVGQRIAEWTHNEAAYVFVRRGRRDGAEHGGLHRRAGRGQARPPARHDGMKNEVIVHQAGWSAMPRPSARPARRSWRSAPRRARRLPSWRRRSTSARRPSSSSTTSSRMKGQVPLEEEIAIARRHGMPLIVDAAAQLPPVENLWHFTQMGADLALFSGGKGLCGPQSSGLILGRKDADRRHAPSMPARAWPSAGR